MTDALTAPQKFHLQELSFHDRVPASRFGPSQIGMLRKLRERGFVGENIHDEWFITDEGRAALAAARGDSEDRT